LRSFDEIDDGYCGEGRFKEEEIRSFCRDKIMRGY